jgi:hypothetical protein
LVLRLSKFHFRNQDQSGIFSGTHCAPIAFFGHHLSSAGGVMGKRESYTRMAVACLKQADEIHDPYQRMTMLGVAQAYMIPVKEA